MNNIVETPRRDVSTKYNSKYRIPTNRLQNWDYSSSAHYFITICTYKKINYFGEIENGIMKPSEIGKIAKDELLNTQIIRNNVRIDEFVIMPNHIHAIIVIQNSQSHALETSHRDVSTNLFTLKPKSLGSIVGQYKSVITKRSQRELRSDFQWQMRYYDNIIRTESSYLKIKKYIRNNPQYWEEDEENCCRDVPVGRL